MSKYMASLAAFLFILALLFISPSSGDDLGDLNKLIASVNDPKMTATDMAFFLATHNYDARPEKDHVDLKVNEKTYKVTFNGSSQGLCKVVPL